MRVKIFRKLRVIPLHPEKSSQKLFRKLLINLTEFESLVPEEKVRRRRIPDSMKRSRRSSGIIPMEVLFQYLSGLLQVSEKLQKHWKKNMAFQYLRMS